MSLGYSGRMMPMTASAMNEITSDRADVEQYNLTHFGPEWADEREKNTASVIKKQKQTLANLQFMGQVPGNAQEVSGMTFFGDFTNTGYKDYQNALSAAGGGAGQIQGASDSTDSGLSSQIGQLIQSMDGVAQVVEKWLGFSGAGN
jgi:hypothetical protein